MVPQSWDISCGAAALATVLTYQQGDKVSEHEVITRLLHYTTPEAVRQRGGFSMLDLKRYAESRVYVAEGDGDMAISDLEAFGPAIVRITVNGQHHFVVFLARQGDRIHVADPAIGNRSLDLKAFETMWDKVALKITRAMRNSGNTASADSSVKKRSGS